MSKAYTLVAKDYKPDSGLEHAGEKWPGGWIFASETTAEASKLHLPEAAPRTEVREVTLPGPLARCATRSSEVPGLWILEVFAPIAPAVEKKARPKKKRKAKARKPKRQPGLFD